jgi:hypothetical protein
VSARPKKEESAQGGAKGAEEESLIVWSAVGEQFMRGFVLDVAALNAVVGSKDRKLVARVLKHPTAEEVNDLIDERHTRLSLEAAMIEIVDGKLRAAHAYEYRRTLEIVAALLGESVAPAPTLPGRGWQELGPAWSHWGLQRLGKIWGGAQSGNRELPWPWTSPRRDRAVRWPIAVIVLRRDVAAVLAEVKAFKAKTAALRGVPTGIARFSDAAYWPVEDLAGEAEHAAKAVAKWLARGAATKRDVLILHDGQQ